MRLGITADDRARTVKRGHHVARGGQAPTTRIEIDPAGQQQAARADYPRQPRACSGRIGEIGGLLVRPGRIARPQVIGHARFGPQHHAPFAKMPRQRQPRHDLELLFVLARIVELFLDPVGLDQREWQRALHVRSSKRQQQQRDRYNCKHGRKARPAIARTMQRSAPHPREQQHQPRHRVSAEPRCDPSKAGPRETAQRHHAQRIPRKTREHPAAQPFADHPRPRQRERRHQQSLAATTPDDQPRQQSRHRNKQRQVQRKQEYRDPAEPARHRCLIREGRGDPAVADREQPNAEQPANHARRASTPAARGRADQPGEGEQC